MPYLKINIVDARTNQYQLSNGNRIINDSSFAGHMWYEIADNNGNHHSFGFGPIETVLKGDGEVKIFDDILYKQEPNNDEHYYSKQVYITEDHYNVLKSFGEDPGKFGFNVSEYNAASNNCINFTWKALSESGLVSFTNLDSDYDGNTFPQDNIENAQNVINAIDSRIDITHQMTLERPSVVSNDYMDFIASQMSFPDDVTPPYGSDWLGFKDWIKQNLEQQLNQSLTDEAFENMLSQISQAEATQQVIRRYDPLILDLDGDGVELTGINNSNAYFDLDADGMSERTGWVSSDDAFLALDKNDNGNIDDIGELFGNQNQSGFSELSEYDSNNDNKIDSSDDIYSSLKIWQDEDGDGITDDGELISLENAQISSINLDGKINVNQNIDGNLIKTIGSYEKTDGTIGQVADIDFNINQSDSQFNGNYDLNINTIFLPFIRGYGDVKALHIAASEDEALMNKLSNLSNLNLDNYNNINTLIEDIIFHWSGTSEVTGDRGLFSAQKLSTLEKFRGDEFIDNWGNGNITAIQRPLIETAWEELFNSLKTKLLIQSTFKDIFNASYDLANDQIILSEDVELENIKSDAEV
ncbi:hypothetical protein N8772_02860, partial [Rickettsiales bacterium]|nr:hypothetical protein [Rickettsiales bacterium]